MDPVSRLTKSESLNIHSKGTLKSSNYALQRTRLAVASHSQRPHHRSEMEKTSVDQTPLGRIGQPGDIASIAVFLASDDSGWLTGEHFLATGGLH